MISRDEPKSQWAEKKAHLYETTDYYVAEEATVSKSLRFLIQKSRHLKIKCGGGIELLGQPVDFMDLIPIRMNDSILR